MRLGATSPIAARNSPGSPGIPSPPARPAELHSRFGHPGAGKGRQGTGCPARAPRRPPHRELIARHRRDSNTSRRGRSRKTLSSQARRGRGSRPHATLRLGTGRLPIPAFLSVALTPLSLVFAKSPGQALLSSSPEAAVPAAPHSAALLLPRSLTAALTKTDPRLLPRRCPGTSCPSLLLLPWSYPSSAPPALLNSIFSSSNRDSPSSASITASLKSRSPRSIPSLLS